VTKIHPRANPIWIESICSESNEHIKLGSENYIYSRMLADAAKRAEAAGIEIFDQRASEKVGTIGRRERLFRTVGVEHAHDTGALPDLHMEVEWRNVFGELLALKEGRSERHLAVFLASGAFVATSGAVWRIIPSRCSIRSTRIELVGTVHEFKYTPALLHLPGVKGADGNTVTWNLEGGAPSLLTRDGWSSRSIKPATSPIDDRPLAQRLPGGAWNATKIKFKDGTTDRGRP